LTTGQDSAGTAEDARDVIFPYVTKQLQQLFTQRLHRISTFAACSRRCALHAAD